MRINLFILSEDPVSLAGLEAIVEQDDSVNLIGTAVDESHGLRWYLARIASPEELFQELHIVARGGAAFSPTIAARFSRFFATIQRLPEPPEFSQLTSRETEVLELLADGMNNRQIARRLFLAEKTVRNYVSRIFTKLEVHDRAAAVLRARDAGFGDQADAVLPQHA
ncbi:response regulator transcription factor [Streptomyces mirabilis]|uniref:response regulator transcription factor n=1 Tax=Streptomyces mirabilis TaxID=68239 RepID=UPI0036E35A0D